MNKYSTHTKGNKYTPEYEIYITENNKIISPFHSIDIHQLTDKKIVTVINEIPRFENGKFEISKNLKYNPIKQDTKNNKLRFVKNIFPYKGYIWNYGAIPQTWEDKDQKCEFTNCLGDNDPLDVLDISTINKKIGQVYQAKILGCLAMIDDGECDWKILVIDINDPLCNKINNKEDIDKYYKNYIESTIYWLKNYKVPDNKPVNKFGLESKFQDQEFAMKIVNEAHLSWKKLISNKHVEDISYEIINHEGVKCEEDGANKECVKEDGINKDGIPEFVNEYYFIN